MTCSPDVLTHGYNDIAVATDDTGVVLYVDFTSDAEQMHPLTFGWGDEPGIYQEIPHLLTALNDPHRANRNIGAVVIRGGEEHFSSGGSVDGIIEPLNERHDDPESVGRFYGATGRTITSIRDSRLPVIATSRGPKKSFCGGGALAIFMACDFAFATPDAVFQTLFTQTGLTADDMGAIGQVFAALGPAKAGAFLFLGHRLTGAELEEAGLVNATYSFDEINDEVTRIAQGLAQSPSSALADGLAAFRELKPGLDDRRLRAGLLAQRGHTQARAMAEYARAFTARETLPYPRHIPYRVKA